MLLVMPLDIISNPSVFPHRIIDVFKYVCLNGFMVIYLENVLCTTQQISIYLHQGNFPDMKKISG